MDEKIRSLVEIQAHSYDRAGAALRDSYPKSSAMDGRRLAEFLEHKRYAVLATARPDGRPHAAPIAFSVWRSVFWIATVAGTRLRNLRAQPYASIVITEGDVRAHHRAVVAEGPVRLYDLRDLAAMDPGLADHWRARHGALPTWAAALVELRPDRVFSFDGTLEQR
jgi:nitroimidazol reductase NimA-like FMN-containing flavoprotein (pyridoxamine 5'-phosphate oxidase superfamily)